MTTSPRTRGSQKLSKQTPRKPIPRTPTSSAVKHKHHKIKDHFANGKRLKIISKSYLRWLFSKCNENDDVNQLKNSSNGIDSCHQDNTRRYKGEPIPEANQTVQKSIYVWHPWKLFCWSISDYSPKCWSKKNQRNKMSVKSENKPCISFFFFFFFSVQINLHRWQEQPKSKDVTCKNFENQHRLTKCRTEFDCFV